MAVHTLWLAARAAGLGLGLGLDPRPGQRRAALDVPTAWRFIGYFCLGYPKPAHEFPELQRVG